MRAFPPTPLTLCFLLLTAMLTPGAVGQEVKIVIQSGPQSTSPQQQLLAVPGRVPGQWRLTPLLLEGAEVSDQPGSRLGAFGESFWLESGALVVWAQLQVAGKPEEGWGVFSLKDGKVRTVTMRGDKGPSAPPVVAGTHVPENLRLCGTGLGQPPEARLPRRYWRQQHTTTPIHASKRLLYISFQTGSASQCTHAYAWDGEQLKKVLAKGDELTVRGQTFRIDYAEVIGVSGDGKALIHFRTGKPQEAAGWVLHDGAGLTPSWMVGDPLPGMPGVRIAALLVESDRPRGSKEGDLWGRADFIPLPVQVRSNAILAALQVTGASYDVALFRLTQQKVEKILAVGEANPLDPKQTIRSISSFEAAGPDTLFISANTSRFAKTSRFTRTLLLSSRVSAQAAAGSKKLLLYHQGQFSRIFDKSAVPASWQGFEVGQVAFLRDDPPLAIYSLSLSRRPTAEDRRHAQKPPPGTVLASVSLTDLYCFDGQKVTNLTERIKPEGQFRVLSGDFPGASFIGTPLDLGSSRNLFVDAYAGEPRVLALPIFSTGGDRTLDLNDVVAWKGPGHAIVGLDDGFHLLTRE